jgi:hypothetical protein
VPSASATAATPCLLSPSGPEGHLPVGGAVLAADAVDVLAATGVIAALAAAVIGSLW